MDEITVERDGDNYLVRLSAQAFASFAFWLLSQNKPSEENGEAKKNRGGRPRKEQASLPEVSA